MQEPPTHPPPVALVTGAARRLGAAIAQCLHLAGARVVLHYHQSGDEALALCQRLNELRADSAALVAADLSNTSALAELAQSASRCFGRLDALINNASAFFPTPIEALKDEDWSQLMNTNLKAPLFLSQAALPWLRDSGGSIVNIVDIHADRPLRHFPLYSLTKSGLAGLTRSLALELAPAVRVNGVAPGAILWPDESDGGPPSFPLAERERITRQTPLGRIGHPDDIAKAVRFFVFDAPFVTGQILAVDGGRSLAL